MSILHILFLNYRNKFLAWIISASILGITLYLGFEYAGTIPLVRRVFRYFYQNIVFANPEVIFRYYSTRIAILGALTFSVLFAAFSPTLVVKAEASSGINRTVQFQGRVVNKTDGTNVANGSYNFVFAIYNASSGGSKLWGDEAQSGIQVTSGVFNVALGSVRSFATDNLDFNQDNLWLDITFNGENFGSRVRLTAVPYAFTAENVNGLTVTQTTGILTIPNAKTISFGDDFTTSGANPLTLTTTGSTNVTLPQSGTLLSTVGAQTIAVSGGDTSVVDTFNLTNTASSGTTTANNLTLGLIGTDNATGTNTLNALNFSNVTSHTNNTYNGLNFGTGYTNLLKSSTITIGAGGAISGATGISSSGTVTFSSLNTNGSLVYADGSGNLSQVASTGTDTQCLVGNASGAPTWGTCGGLAAADMQLSTASIANSLTNISTTPVYLTTVSITPTKSTGDIMVRAFVSTSSRSATDQTVSAEIRTASGSTCNGTLLATGTAFLNSASGANGPLVYAAYLDVNPGNVAKDYAVCAYTSLANGANVAGGSFTAEVVDGGSGATGGSGSSGPFAEDTLNGLIFQNNSTEDFLIGGVASDSAKFAVLNINSGVPTASVSAGLAGASFLTADGFLSATARQNLTIGNSSTYNTSGNILLNPNGTGNVGIGRATPTATLDVNGTASISGQLTLDYATPTIQTTNNSGLTIGGNTTGQLILSSSNGTQNIILAGYTTAGCTLKTDNTGLLTCGVDAGSGSSPFGTSSGIISKTTSSDQLLLTMAQAGTYGLKVDTSTAPTVDLVQLTNTSNGTTTTGVDGLQVDFATSGTTSSADNSGLRVNVTSGNSGASTTLQGISIGDLSGAQANSTETGLSIGAGWDVGINVQSGAIVTSNMGIQVTDSDTNPSCSSGDYKIYADTSDARLKKCQNGTVSDLAQDSDVINRAKSADQSVTNSTTLADETALQFTINPGEEWNIYWNLTVSNNNSATPDWKAAIVAPTGSTCRVTQSGVEPAGTAFPEATSTNCTTPTTLVDNAILADANVPFPVNIIANIQAGGTGGTVKLQFAENTGGAGTSITVKEGSIMNAYRVTGADLAEVYYTNDSDITPGTVVSLDPSFPAGVKKSVSANEGNVLGVISTRPGLVIGGSAGNTQGRPVFLALAGRVPVKASVENGAIQPGDYLTSSSTPGVAMKSNGGGKIIGQALSGTNVDGTVTVFIQNSAVSASQSLLSQNDNSFLGTINLNTDSSLTQRVANLEDKLASVSALLQNSSTTQSVASNSSSLSLDQAALTEDGLTFLGGAIKFDKDGNIATKGTIFSSSADFANDIVVHGAIRTPRIFVDKFENQILSDSQIISSSSAGMVTIKASQHQLEMQNNLIEGDSVILLTPRKEVKTPVYISEQEAGKVVVKTNSDETQDINVNFMIVNLRN